MYIYAVHSKPEGNVLVYVETDLEKVRKKVFLDRFVEIWKDGKRVKTIEGQDLYKEESWIL